MIVDIGSIAGSFSETAAGNRAYSWQWPLHRWFSCGIKLLHGCWYLTRKKEKNSGFRCCQRATAVSRCWNNLKSKLNFFRVHFIFPYHQSWRETIYILAVESKSIEYGEQAFGDRCCGIRARRESQSTRFKAESVGGECCSSRSNLQVKLWIIDNLHSSEGQINYKICFVLELAFRYM